MTKAGSVSVGWAAFLLLKWEKKLTPEGFKSSQVESSHLAGEVVSQERQWRSALYSLVFLFAPFFVCSSIQWGDAATSTSS